jgi:SAM-dependent methyltransferase
MEDEDRRRWAAAAERYGPGWAQADAPDLGWLVDAISPDPAARAIDVGAGAGHVTRALARLVTRVDAVDPVPEMRAVAERLSAAAGLANTTFHAGFAESLPFGEATFDIAVSRFSVHHWRDPARAFREIARVVRPGGRLAIVDMIGPAAGSDATFLATVELLRDPSHAHSLASWEWLSALDAAGFDARVLRTWEIRHDTRAWLDQTDPPTWRRAAVDRILREAPELARQAFRIEVDGSAFSVGCGLFAGTRR